MQLQVEDNAQQTVWLDLCAFVDLSSWLTLAFLFLEGSTNKMASLLERTRKSSIHHGVLICLNLACSLESRVVVAAGPSYRLLANVHSSSALKYYLMLIVSSLSLFLILLLLLLPIKLGQLFGSNLFLSLGANWNLAAPIVDTDSRLHFAF